MSAHRRYVSTSTRERSQIKKIAYEKLVFLFDVKYQFNFYLIFIDPPKVKGRRPEKIKKADGQIFLSEEKETSINIIKGVYAHA